MWRVPKPKRSAADLFEAISNQRKTLADQALVASCTTAVNASYAAYDSAATASADAVSQLTPTKWQKAEAKALKANYDLLISSESEPLAKVYDDLRIAAPFCPMCGERPAIELDHYLPRAVFAEFSVLPLNLVPVCPQCNKTKRAKYKWVCCTFR